MMENNRKYLTSEEVQEFEGLGVSFTDTSNLQDVLEILPSRYTVDVGMNGHKHYTLNIYTVVCTSGRDWVFAYKYPSESNAVYFSDENPLVAAINLLRWVCKNHPETLQL